MENVNSTFTVWRASDEQNGFEMNNVRKAPFGQEFLQS